MRKEKKIITNHFLIFSVCLVHPISPSVLSFLPFWASAQALCPYVPSIHPV
jgi:hypothetical protein